MSSHRSSRGGAIAETGPALFVLFVLILFPLISILGVAGQFACAWYHNHLMLEELAVRTAADGGAGNPGNNATSGPTGGGAVHTQIVNSFDHTGIAAFVGVTAITDRVVYFGPVTAGVPAPARVECLSTLTGRPFISLPMFGFTKTVFTVAGEATREVTR